VSGIATYKDQPGWFEAVFNTSADEFEYPRRLILYEIERAEFDQEWRLHREREAIGGSNHCSHDGAPPPATPSKEAVTNFKLTHKRINPMCSERQILGWFRPYAIENGRPY
jgi:hypothetical protein